MLFEEIGNMQRKYNKDVKEAWDIKESTEEFYINREKWDQSQLEKKDKEIENLKNSIKNLEQEKQNTSEQLDNTEDVEQEVTEDDGFEEDLIGSLKIEKINLNGTVKEGSTNEILRDYIGHIEETAKYDGNVGLAAHNRGNKYSYFARINELEPGDEIVYTTKYGERKYIVDTKKEILETDWSKLEGTTDNRLTLITCIKNKVNQRLCVQAVQEKI